MGRTWEGEHSTVNFKSMETDLQISLEYDALGEVRLLCEAGSGRFGYPFRGRLLRRSNLTRKNMSTMRAATLTPTLTMPLATRTPCHSPTVQSELRG